MAMGILHTCIAKINNQKSFFTFDLTIGMIGVTFLINTAKAAQFYTKCQDIYDIVKSHTWQNRLCKLNTYMSDEIEIVLFCVKRLKT